MRSDTIVVVLVALFSIVCPLAVSSSVASDIVNGASSVESDKGLLGSSYWIGILMASVAGLSLGSMTVAVMHWWPAETSSKRHRRALGKPSNSGCACCH